MFSQFSILARTEAQPLKKGNNHHFCFSPGQGAGSRTWGAIQEHPLVWQDLSPPGGAGCARPSVQCPFTEGTQLLRMAVISSWALPCSCSGVPAAPRRR